MRDPSRSGATLIVAVLVLIGVTVLLGIGRLAAFRHQVQLRLDREREIQQTLATRSVMRWLVDKFRKRDEGYPEGRTTLPFSTARGQIRAAAIRAEPIFPQPGNPLHFNAGCTNVDHGSFARFKVAPFRADSGSPLMPGLPAGYVRCSLDDETLDPGRYDTDSHGWRAVILGSEQNATGTVAWLVVDLHTNFVDGTLWTDDFYGRRYLVELKHLCVGTADSGGDRLRFGLTPFGQALSADSAKNGDPVSQYAIWLEEQVSANDEDVSLALASRGPGSESDAGSAKRLWSAKLLPERATWSPGFQLSDRRASLVLQHTEDVSHADPLRSTSVVGSPTMEERFVAGFTNACAKAGGIRLTIELDILQTRENVTDNNKIRTGIKRIAVTPAYEYSIELAWPDESADGGIDIVREISTVCRIDPHYRVPDGQIPDDIITYDTHGTEATRKHQARDERAAGWK